MSDKTAVEKDLEQLELEREARLQTYDALAQHVQTLIEAIQAIEDARQAGDRRQIVTTIRAAYVQACHADRFMFCEAVYNYPESA